MAITSSQIPLYGPPAPRTRGVRWEKSAPAGYRRLTITNSAGVTVKQEDILETLLDGEEIARAYVWLDDKCPELAPEDSRMPSGIPTLFVMG